MNVLKPIVLCAVAALVISIGVQVAFARGACGNQPRMQAAIEHLRQARTALEQAEHNKGGWRDRAIQATDETNTACAFADTH